MDVLETVYQKSDTIVFRRVGEEFVLVPIRRNVGDLDSIYTLNETGARIWEWIDGKTKVEEIGDRILEEFEVTPDEAQRDLVEHLRQLEEIGAITAR